VSRIVLVNQSSTPDDAGSGNAQLFIEGNELYQQVGTGNKTKVANETTSTFTSSLSAPSVSAINTGKAWVNWTQVSTQTVRDSFNVSGIVDEGVGRTTINFVHNFNTHDSWVATGASNFYGSDTISASTAKFATFYQTCSSIYIYCNDNGTNIDSYWCHFAAFGKNDNPLT
jgi:hypothetical protein